MISVTFLKHAQKNTGIIEGGGHDGRPRKRGQAEARSRRRWLTTADTPSPRMVMP
jgi:hypothetical protein